MRDSVCRGPTFDTPMKQNIFEQSQGLAEVLGSFTRLPLANDSDRFVVSDVLCSLSLEHWEVSLGALEGGNLPSAVVVHRAQFEALVRSVWVLCAAPHAQVDKLSIPLTLESEQGAKNLPQVTDMMAALERSGPTNAFIALNRFKENSWKALNSYVHAGIHSVSRHRNGYPAQLIESVVRNANGLAVLGAIQCVVLAGKQPLQIEILSRAEHYAECLPPSV